MKTAILVDGGFYRKRANLKLGKKTPEERATELFEYCIKHLSDNSHGEHKEHAVKHSQRRIQTHSNELYRIFYYDCPPISKKMHQPVTKQSIDFSKSHTYSWTTDFFQQLKQKRKLALRLGELSDKNMSYTIKDEVLKSIQNGKKKFEDLTDADYRLSNLTQKGVDMKIGIDIASLSYKKQVSKIILISGDSDFVPAAKLARREGIDFILDPLFCRVKDSLFEHIDGMHTHDYRFK